MRQCRKSSSRVIGMTSDQDQDGGEHRRASHNSAHMSSAPRQRLAGRIPERRVDLARRGHAGQLVVAVVVVVHCSCRQPFLCRRGSPSVLRACGAGSVGPARRRGGSGAAFVASFMRERHVSTDRSRGSRGASEPRLPWRSALAYVPRVLVTVLLVAMTYSYRRTRDRVPFRSRCRVMSTTALH